MTSRRALLSVGCAAAVAGCSLLTDLGGLAGGPSADAGADATTAIDGAADATVDTWTPPDADADAGADGDAGADADGAPAPGFCMTHPAHAACLDFDDGGLPSDWTQYVSLGSVTWSSTVALSPPGALRSTVPRRPTNKEYAELRKKMSSDFHRVVVELDLYVEPPAWQAGDINAGVFDIGLYSSTVNTGVATSVGQTYVTLGNPGAALAANPVRYAKWIHAKFDLDPAGTYDVTLDGASFHQTFAPLDAGLSPSTQVILGVDGYNAPAPEFIVYYDNVLIDLP
jgi:hypothetical protein